jgi:hypothetical protein
MAFSSAGFRLRMRRNLGTAVTSDKPAYPDEIHRHVG